MRRGSARAALVGFLALVVVVIAGYSFYLSRCQWIEAGYAGVMFSPSGLRPGIIPPKRVFVPFTFSLYQYPTMLTSAIYTNNPTMGENKTADAIEITTNDGVTTPFDVVVWYRIKPEDIPTVASSFRTLSIHDIQTQYLRRLVKSKLQYATDHYSSWELMSSSRKEASDAITKILAEEAATKGLTVTKLEICAPYPNDLARQRAAQRVKSLTGANIATLRNEIAKVKSQIAIVQSKAATEAQRLEAATTTSKSQELLLIEAKIQGYKRWNGRQAMFKPVRGATVVITPDALAQLPKVVPPAAEAPQEEPAQPEQSEENK